MFDLTFSAATVTVLNREAVIACLVALDDAVAAVGKYRGFGAITLILSVGQDAARPPVLHSAVLVASVLISSVTIITQFAVLNFQLAVPAKHLESWVRHHHTLVSTDPSLLHLAQTAATISAASVAVVAVLALEGFSDSVATVAYGRQTN